MSTEKTTNYVSFIWKIANLLRGDYKEHEYGDVILPFTVLTRLDSVLVSTKDKVSQIRDQKGVPAEVKHLQYAKATGYPFWNTSRFTLHTLKNDPDNLEGNLRSYVNGFSPNARDVSCPGVEREKHNLRAQIVVGEVDDGTPAGRQPGVQPEPADARRVDI